MRLECTSLPCRIRNGHPSNWSGDSVVFLYLILETELFSISVCMETNDARNISNVRLSNGRGLPEVMIDAWHESLALAGRKSLWFELRIYH